MGFGVVSSPFAACADSGRRTGAVGEFAPHRKQSVTHNAHLRAPWGVQDHHKLRIWRLAGELAAADRFPSRGYAELKSHIISAAESIHHTIAEGCGAESPKEFARFLSISIKSDRELESELEMARRYRILSEARWRVLTEETIRIRRMTYALRKRVLAADSE